MFVPSRRLPRVNFQGSVELGSWRPIVPKLEYVNQRIQLHIRSDLHRYSLCLMALSEVHGRDVDEGVDRDLLGSATSASGKRGRSPANVPARSN
jgi:hypothetical protein